MICTSCNKDLKTTSFYPGHTVCKSCYYKLNKGKSKKELEREDDDKYYAIGARCLGRK